MRSLAKILMSVSALVAVALFPNPCNGANVYWSQDACPTVPKYPNAISGYDEFARDKRGADNIVVQYTNDDVRTVVDYFKKRLPSWRYFNTYPNSYPWIEIFLGPNITDHIEIARPMRTRIAYCRYNQMLSRP